MAHKEAATITTTSTFKAFPTCICKGWANGLWPHQCHAHRWYPRRKNHTRHLPGRFSSSTGRGQSGSLCGHLVGASDRCGYRSHSHTALHHFQYSDEVTEPVVLINPSKLMGTGQLLSASLSIDPKNGRVSGHVRQNGEMSAAFSVWFVMDVEPSPISWGTWSGTN